jgi:hypothetical protein
MEVGMSGRRLCFFLALILVLFTGCQNPAIRRAPAANDAALDSALTQLKSYLIGQRPAGTPYWSGAFTSDVTSDALMLALGTRLNDVNKMTMTPDLAESYAKSMAERMTTEKDGWPAYEGGPADFNITAIALMCLKYAGFASGDKKDYAHFQDRFQHAADWFRKQGGLKKVHHSSDQMYVRLMLGPCTSIRTDFCAAWSCRRSASAR